MDNVTIYTWAACPYCTSAKALLDRRGIAYTEIEVDKDVARAMEMSQRSGRRTVPQVFVGNRLIGGNDDLHSAEASGLLDALLTDAASRWARSHAAQVTTLP